MAAIRDAGDRAVNDNLSIIFVQGAYNLGEVIINREIETAAIHPGEGVNNATGAGGEDHIVLMLDKALNPLGICELDLGQIAGCSSDYAVADQVPVIPFHMNPGALLRNIQCVNPAAAVEPNQGLTSSSGTAGSFADFVEADVVVEDNAKYCFGDTLAGVVGAAGTMLYQRIYLRNAYHVPDPAAAYVCVAYIWN